jgi:hypothetical protein
MIVTVSEIVSGPGHGFGLGAFVPTKLQTPFQSKGSARVVLVVVDVAVDVVMVVVELVLVVVLLVIVLVVVVAHTANPSLRHARTICRLQRDLWRRPGAEHAPS